jgi:hemerythrin superfamily protein
MNAIELLKKDHRTVESLFESFEKAKEQESETSKAELFASIKEELDAHARVEEEIFYPAFDRAAEKEDDKELVLEAGEEHKQVKTLLAELEGLDPDDETFDAKMKVLKDNVEHHVKEEEGEMFPHARKELGDEELEQLGQRIAARKEQIQQQPPAARPGRSQGSPSRARATSPGRRSGRKSSSGGDEAVRASDGSGSELLESMGMTSGSEGASRRTASRRSSSGGSARSSSSSSRSRGGSSRSSGSRSGSSSRRSSGARRSGARSSRSGGSSRGPTSSGRSSSSRGRSTSSRRGSSSSRGRSGGRGRGRSART